MSEERPGIVVSIWRFFTFYRWRKSLAIQRAADRQFTGSSEGISDAFELERKKMAANFEKLRGAVGLLQSVLDERTDRMAQLNAKEQEVLIRRDRSFANLAEAKEAGNTDEEAEHEAAFCRYDEEIQQIEEEQAHLEVLIAESKEAVGEQMIHLTELDAKIKALPERKAAAIAEFISAKQIDDVSRQLSGMSDDLESGPIQAVLAANKELTGKARVSMKLARTDSSRQDAKYDAEGRATTSKARLATMLAARKAESEAKAEPEQTEAKPRTKEKGRAKI
jgi:hypothetical protein